MRRFILQGLQVKEFIHPKELENKERASYLLKLYLGPKIYGLNNPELYELFNDIYINNKAISTLVAKYDKSELELVALKKYILSHLINPDFKS